MDESIVKHLTEQTEAQRLAAAIRRGKKILDEDEDQWSWRLCALGCAFAGERGRVMSYQEQKAFIGGSPQHTPFRLVAERIAGAIGYSKELGFLVNELHLNGLPALEIAARLERGEV